MATVDELLTEASQLYDDKKFAEARAIYQQLINEHATYKELLFDEADKLFKLSAYEHTLFILLLLTETIADEEIFYYIGYCYLRLHNYAQATAWFEKTTQRWPDFSKGFAGWGDSLHKQQKTAEALSKYRTSLSLTPSVKLATNVLSTMGHSLQQYQEVLDILNDRPTLVSPFDRERLTGEMEAKLGHYEKAADAFERAALLDSQLVADQLDTNYNNLIKIPTAPAYLTNALTATETAVRELTQQLVNPKLPAPDLAASKANLEVTTQKAARLAFWLGKQRFDQYERSEKGQDFDLREAMDEIWSYWHKTIQYVPASEFTKRIGDDLFNKSQWDKTAQAYEVYRAEHTPTSAEYALATAMIGACAFYQFDYDLAKQWLQKAALIESTYQYYAYYHLAMVWNAEGMANKGQSADQAFHKAESCYRKAFELAPRQLFVVEGLTSFLTARQQKNEALAVCRKAMTTYVNAVTDETERQKRRSDVAYLKGNVHLDMHEIDNAVASYKDAIEYDNHHLFAIHNLAHSLEKKGDYKAALKHWNSVQKLYEQQLQQH